MSFGGGGGGTSTTTSRVEPYAPAQPALNQIISEAGTIYGQGPAGTGYVPPSQQTLELLDKPLVIQAGEILKAQASAANQLHVIVSYLEIT